MYEVNETVTLVRRDGDGLVIGVEELIQNAYERSGICGNNQKLGNSDAADDDIPGGGGMTGPSITQQSHDTDKTIE